MSLSPSSHTLPGTDLPKPQAKNDKFLIKVSLLIIRAQPGAEVTNPLSTLNSPGSTI